MKLAADRLFMTDADDQLVILDASDSSYLTVNPSGRILIDALREDISLDELTVVLISHFDLDRSVAAADCSAFIAELDQRGWLVST